MKNKERVYRLLWKKKKNMFGVKLNKGFLEKAFQLRLTLTKKSRHEDLLLSHMD